MVVKTASVDMENLKSGGYCQILVFHILSTHSDSGMVMTLQLTRMVVMMAKLNMGWVKTMRAIRRIGWNGERSQSAFVAENLRLS